MSADVSLPAGCKPLTKRRPGPRPGLYLKRKKVQALAKVLRKGDTHTNQANKLNFEVFMLISSKCFANDKFIAKTQARVDC